MKTALVVIDMQNGFMNKFTRQLVPRLRKLLDRNRFDFVLFTKFINRAHSPFVQLIGYKRLQRSPETEIVPELARYAKHLFVKPRYTPFTNKFSAFLRRERISHLYFAGVDTNACVHTGAVDAFSKGYIPIVLADYCASHSGKEYHKFALKNLQKLIGNSQVVPGEPSIPKGGKLA